VLTSLEEITIFPLTEVCYWINRFYYFFYSGFFTTNGKLQIILVYVWRTYQRMRKQNYKDLNNSLSSGFLVESNNKLFYLQILFLYFLIPTCRFSNYFCLKAINHMYVFLDFFIFTQYFFVGSVDNYLIW
jgi:hypothetical protein